MIRAGDCGRPRRVVAQTTEVAQDRFYCILGIVGLVGSGSQSSRVDLLLHLSVVKDAEKDKLAWR